MARRTPQSWRYTTSNQAQGRSMRQSPLRSLQADQSQNYIGHRPNVVDSQRRSDRATMPAAQVRRTRRRQIAGRVVEQATSGAKGSPYGIGANHVGFQRASATSVDGAVGKGLGSTASHPRRPIASETHTDRLMRQSGHRSSAPAVQPGVPAGAPEQRSSAVVRHGLGTSANREHQNGARRPRAAIGDTYVAHQPQGRDGNTSRARPRGLPIGSIDSRLRGSVSGAGGHQLQSATVGAASGNRRHRTYVLPRNAHDAGSEGSPIALGAPGRGHQGRVAGMGVSAGIDRHHSPIIGTSDNPANAHQRDVTQHHNHSQDQRKAGGTDGSAVQPSGFGRSRMAQFRESARLNATHALHGLAASRTRGVGSKTDRRSTAGSDPEAPKVRMTSTGDTNPTAGREAHRMNPLGSPIRITSNSHNSMPGPSKRYRGSSRGSGTTQEPMDRSAQRRPDRSQPTQRVGSDARTAVHASETRTAQTAEDLQNLRAPAQAHAVAIDHTGARAQNNRLPAPRRQAGGNPRANALASAAQTGVDRLGARIAASATAMASGAPHPDIVQYRRMACTEEQPHSVKPLIVQTLREAAMARIPHEDCREASIGSPRCSNVKSVAGISLRGHNPMLRKTNQDAMVMVEHAGTESLLVAVFDGHGVHGHDVSGFVARSFVQALLLDSRFTMKPKPAAQPDLCSALADALQVAEVQLIRDSGIDCSLSGSTAVASIIRGSQLWSVCVGDSRLICVRQQNETSCSAQSITTDHKPDMDVERARVIAAGGRVMSTRNRLAPHIVGPPRVWLKDVPAPGLAMSRSLGDLVAKAAGVVSAPDRVHFILGEDHSAIVLGSDGLWDFTPNAIVAANAVHYTSKQCVDSLMRVSRARWISRTGGSDDITIVVVHLK